MFRPNRGSVLAVQAWNSELPEGGTPN